MKMKWKSKLDQERAREKERESERVGECRSKRDRKQVQVKVKAWVEKAEERRWAGYINPSAAASPFTVGQKRVAQTIQMYFLAKNGK
jgi:hypothetical protein